MITRLVTREVTESPTRLAAGLPIPLLLMPLQSDLRLLRGVGSVDFARSTAGTSVDQDDGLVKTSRQNLLSRSEEFDNASWTKSNLVVTSDQVIATDGTLTADKLDDNSSSLGTTSQTPAVTSNTLEHTFSVFLKAGTSNIVELEMVYGGVTVGGRVFDLSDGSSIDRTSLPVSSFSITAFTNNWFRISIGLVNTNRTSLQCIIRPAWNTVLSGDFSNAAQGAMFAWGAQVEEASTNGPYIRTTASSSFAARFEQNGILIEGASTNLLLRSEEFDNAAWTDFVGGTGITPVRTANFAIAPDGTMTADRMQFDLDGGTTSGDFSGIRQTLTTAATGTVSLFIKSNDNNTYDLQLNFAGADTSIQATPDSFVRVDAPYTFIGSNEFRIALRGARSVTNSDTADIIIWGGMLEELPFASSYIKTVASTVTRTADNLSIPALNFDKLGPELVINGTFDTDISSWTAIDGSTPSFDAGRIKATSNAGFGKFEQQVPTVAGKTYRIEADLDAGTSAKAFIFAGPTANSNAYFQKETATTDTIDVTFVATASVMFLRGRCDDEALSTNTFFDNITVKEVISLNIPAPTLDYSVSATVDKLGFTGFSRLYEIPGENARRLFIDSSGGITGKHTNNVTAGSAITDTDAHKIAFTVDSTNGTVFLDGIQKAQASKGVVTGTATGINIGREVASNYLFGHIKNFRIDNVALTAAQVGALP